MGDSAPFATLVSHPLDIKIAVPTRAALVIICLMLVAGYAG